MEEESKGALTIGDFFRVIFRRKWIVLAVTVAALLIGVLLIQLVVNPIKTSYQVYFSMEYPGRSSVYPDGKTFRFQDMTSLEYLQAVKASDEKFADIDVEKMSENDGITIFNTSVREESGETDKEEITINEKLYEYKFVAQGKYFPNEETATAFLRALAAYPAEYTKSSLEKVSFTKNLLSYDSASVKRYSDKLSILNNQYSSLVSQYGSLINSFGDNLVIKEKSLRVWLNELETAYGEYDRSSLSSRLSRYGYTFDDEVLKKSNDDLVYEYQMNEAKISNYRKAYEELIKTSSGIVEGDSILNEMTNLQNRNADIQFTLDFRGITTDKTSNVWSWKVGDTAANENFKKESVAFGAELDAVKTVLEQQAVICKEVVAATYGQQARVIFSNNRLEKQGATGLVKAALLSVLIGLVAVCVVVLIIDMPKYSRKKKEACGVLPVTSSVPSAEEDEQLAEAAAASDTEQSGNNGKTTQD